MTTVINFNDLHMLDCGEPMALRLEHFRDVAPSPCQNVDGIGEAIETAHNLLDLLSDSEGYTVWIWAGPVQDDEHPDVSEASYRVWRALDDDTWVQGLDPSAEGWLRNSLTPARRRELFGGTK